jgi:hypothetical protein
MSGVYIPGAFSKKKLVVEIPAESKPESKPETKPETKLETRQEPKPEPKPNPAKIINTEIKPVEIKQSAWGGKKSFVECLKANSSEPQPKEEPVVIKKNSMLEVYKQKEIRKEELEDFMQKYDGKLRKLYEKSIYYEKEYFSKLRINGEQGYITFCKFMFHVILI